MERKYYLQTLRTTSCASIIFISYATYSDHPIKISEEYYGSDINAAIIEANQNTRTANYKNKYWYKRTTSRSFYLPKMNYKELENTQLKGALQATSSGLLTHNKPLVLKKVNHAINELLKLNSNEETLIKGKVKETEIQSDQGEQPAVNIVLESTHKFSRGDIVTTRDFISVGTITSTPRP